MYCELINPITINQVVKIVVLFYLRERINHINLKIVQSKGKDILKIGNNLFSNIQKRKHFINSVQINTYTNIIFTNINITFS